MSTRPGGKNSVLVGVIPPGDLSFFSWKKRVVFRERFERCSRKTLGLTTVTDVHPTRGDSSIQQAAL